jgi:hypothetical protein
MACESRPPSNQTRGSPGNPQDIARRLAVPRAVTVHTSTTNTIGEEREGIAITHRDTTMDRTVRIDDV